MEVGVIVDDVGTHGANTATAWLARALVSRGYGVWMLGAGELGVDERDRVVAVARRAPGAGAAPADFMGGVRAAPPEPISVGGLDVLLVRCNPGKGALERWAWTALLGFCRLAEAEGAVVLNEPGGLSQALDKLYFHTFPASTRPRGIVSRSRDALRAFVTSLDGPAVLKPLSGSGGSGVFLVRPPDLSNLNAIIEVLSASGFVVAQAYLPEAASGDTRLLMLEGRPLAVDGVIAAVGRRPGGGDLRSNIAAGGSAVPGVVTPAMLELARRVGPRLQTDGVFLAGLDVIGDKLVEINVFSPGGLQDASAFTGVDFAAPIAEAMERRVNYSMKSLS